MAPKSPSQFEEIRKESREKILNAALKLFAEESYHATSISKIAKEASVSKGLMYNYFQSKEDLLNAILEDAMKQGDQLAAEMMKAETPQDQIKCIIDLGFEWIINHEQYSKTLMSLSLQVGKFPQIQKMVDGKIEGMKQFYTHLFKQLGFENPAMEAKTFGALMDGIGLQYVSVGDKMGITEIKQFLIDKYCNNSKTPTK
ncbi:MAG: TetR/AcrR family transcriptional regulator [Bacteroidia bacterium]